MLTDREQKVWNELQQWETQLRQSDPTSISLTIENWMEQSFAMLPEHIQEQFFHVLDDWCFHLYAMIQSSQFQTDAKKRILNAGRTFATDIDKVSEMKQLPLDHLQYIANEQMTRHRLYSFLQGGLSGTGNVMLLGADIPALAVINLRVIQLISMTYGYQISNPFEIMTSLKLFHGASLPSGRQGEVWLELLDDLKETEHPYFYDGSEKLLTISSLEQPLKQLLKLIVIMLFRKKRFQGIPLVGMALGAGVNYRLTKQMTEFTHKYYQYRYLYEKRGV